MKKLILSAALILGGTGAAEAAQTIYNGRAAFDAATTASVVDTFGTAAGSAYVGATPYVRSGYTVTASDAWLFNNNPSVTSYYYDWGTGNVMTFKQSGTVTLTFDTPITAFGVDLGTFFQSFPQPTQYAYSVAVGTPEGTINVNTAATQSLTFFGVTSTSGISSITLTGGSGNFTVFDNVTLATGPAAVPEPAAWALMITGLGLVGAGVRSRRSSVHLNLA